MVRRILVILASASLCVTVVVAAAGPASAKPKKLQVVAAFYPLAWVIERVGGSNVKVTNLTPAGTEPHDLELTTKQRDAIEDAALVVVIGKGFQPALEKVAAGRDEHTLKVLDELPIDVDGKTAEEDEHSEGSDKATLDPHVWLDPVLMRDVVHDVTVALVKADKQRAKQYRANSEDLEADLDALDSEFSSGLAGCERTIIVTAHEAFGYLTARYGLSQKGITGLSPDAEPTPARLAELSDLVTREGVTTIFTEDFVSPRIAETLAREAGGLKTAVLSPLEGLTEDQLEAEADYLSVMRGNLDELERALGCP